MRKNSERSIWGVFFICMIILALCSLFSSCEDKGTTRMSLNGTEQNLPDELKGLKVYTVSTSNQGGYIRVAVLNNQINSITYPVGKFQATTIIVGSGKEQRLINAKEIISETDSIIVIKK